MARRKKRHSQPNIDVRLSEDLKAFLHRAATEHGFISGPRGRYGLARFVLATAVRRAKQILKEEPPE